MRSKMIVGVLLSIVSMVTIAGSCKDCETTYYEHYRACRGDTICQERVKEAYRACMIGCAR